MAIMNEKCRILYLLLNILALVNASDVLGCGGFIKSHVHIDFSKVLIKLYTKQGILKDSTSCAPNNGYYFIPLYDKGDYVLQLEAPAGWSFDPIKVALSINGKTDVCSQGNDINFVFKGFGITGKVESLGSTNGPAGVRVELKSNTEVRVTTTSTGGNFFFTPVFPGQYNVTVSHPKWKFLKNKMSVKVTEGNSDLSPNSLIVQGYDVRGSVKSDGEAISGVTVLLHASEGSEPHGQVYGCDKSDFTGIRTEKNYLCHVTSNQNGVFEFPTVSVGNYYVIPFYTGHNIHFQPSSIKFSVGHDSLFLTNSFEIVGFSVAGRVLSAEGGKPLEGAVVYLNGEEIGNTKSDGSYSLTKIKAGTYSLLVKAENLRFEEKFLKVNPRMLQLPDVFPSSYLVCGTVISENSLTVTVTKVGSTQHLSVNSEPSTGKFCEYLKPGRYTFEVIVSDAEKSRGIQFFPISQVVEVSTSPIFDIVFSQLKVTLLGKVRCIRAKDCSGLNVILRSFINAAPLDSKDVMADVNGDSYIFDDIRPGTYEVLIVPNRLCWRESKFIITVNSVKVTIPTFIQNGYTIVFSSSHETKVTYKTPTQDQRVLSLNKGRSTHCVESAGTYNFVFESCHIYDNNKIIYDTHNETNEIIISAIKHKHSVSLSSVADFGNIFVTVNIGVDKILHGPLLFKDKENRYTLNLFLSPSEEVILIPKSEILYFDPPILPMSGHEDCVDLGVKFKALKGRVFKGKVIPPLAGAHVTVVTDNSDSLMDITDANGNYKFPPLDDSKTYKITAEKDSFVLVGPDEEGNFLAHKLAEIIVEVLDQVDNKPLQGALLSLSGEQSYRSNLQTNQEGRIIFNSLSPSQYFLRPMMKEYSFEPESKIIDVQEGATVNVQLKGRRVAYSVFGQVASLNGEPEDKMIVVAAGTGNCSQYSEESTSEYTGQFRIRGLLPYCSYELTVQGSLDDKETFERAVPSSIEIQGISRDIEDVKLIAFRAIPNIDVLVRVYASNPEHYKSLRVKVSRESPPTSLVHVTKIDTTGYKVTKDYNAGVLIQLPSVPLDSKQYSVQLESSLAQFNKVKPHVEYFMANTSFKYVDLEFMMKTNTTDQHIKQTSIWTLAFIFCGMVAAYNVEKIIQLMKENLSRFNIDLFQSFKAKIPEKDFTADTNDIDQIVQSINATKRKIKPKKI